MMPDGTRDGLLLHRWTPRRYHHPRQKAKPREFGVSTSIDIAIYQLSGDLPGCPPALELVKETSLIVIIYFFKTSPDTNL